MIQPRGLKARFEEAKRSVGSDCIDFLQRILTIDPKLRMSASEALAHPYLSSAEPRPCQPSELPRFESDISQKFVKK